MTKLKSAKTLKQEWTDCKHVFFEDFIQAIQQNAIEAALELAAKETTKFEYNTPIVSPTTIQNKRKILSLINHKDLKV